MCTKKKRIKKKLDMEAPIIAALGKRGQEDSMGKASLDHRGEPFSPKPTTKEGYWGVAGLLVFP